jgi:predicted AAA+ superfamily ATPase
MPSEDTGHIIETAVFHALQHQNDDIYYWKRQGEIDFLVRKGITIIKVIQVAADGVDTVEILKRELQSLEEAKAVFPQAKQIIIVNMPKQKLQKDIEIIPVWQFLMD